LAQGVAAVQEGRHEEAGVFMERTLQANPSLSSLYFIGAAALALGGRLEVAQAWAKQGLAMEPGFRCRLFRELIVHRVADRLAEGGRLLGLPA
jgi:adenylate cyclase